VVTAGGAARILRNVPARRFATLILCLASLGVISAGVNGYNLLDLGKAMRLFLFAAFVVVAVHWGRVRGENFVLRTFLLGLAVGGAVNLFFTYYAPYLMLGPLSVLRAQNGAGGALAIAVGLGAWLMLTRESRADTVVAVVVTLIGVTAAALSFSKTSILIAACGLLAWFYVITYTFARHRRRMAGGAVVLLLLAIFGYTHLSEEMSLYANAVVKAVTIKFTNVSLTDKYSVGTRYQYFFGVAEVLAAHPITGVSHGGFYDAITHTETYHSGEMAEEDPEGAETAQANPHNTFLNYAAANGVPGLVLSVLIYIVFVAYLYRSLDGIGFAGSVLCGSIALAYFIYGNTLQTMYDTAVLYVPVSVAIARVTKQRAARWREALTPAPPVGAP
jgi:O-antigen ligase